MKAKILKIIDAGNLQKERVVIKCGADEDVGEYLLIKTGANDQLPNIGVTRTFWFPDKEVSKNDFVVLYSKSGTQSEKESGGSKYHFFYWGSETPLWEEAHGRQACVLMHVSGWEFLLTNSPA